MGFINWGSESPEQLAHRRRLEEEAIFEQAVRMARMRGNNAPAPNAGAVGGGKSGKYLATLTSQLIVSNIEGSPNFQVHIFDYDNLKINGPVDTGAKSSEFEVWDRYTLQDRGYAIHFRGTIDTDRYIVVYLDAAGNLIKSIAGTSGGFDMDYTRGEWVYAIDVFLQTVWVFSGDKVTEFTQFADSTNLYIGSDGTDSTSDGLGIVSMTDNLDGTWTTKFYLVDPNTHEVTEKISIDGPEQVGGGLPRYEDNFILYSFSNTIVREVYDGDDSIYTDIFIYDPDGNILHHYDMPSGYNDRNYYQYGSGNILWVFSNYSDDGVDYLVVNYNGSTDTLTDVTHARGLDYPSYQVSSDYLYTGELHDSDSSNNALVAFYKATGYYYYLDEIDGCDFLTFFAGNPVPQLITLDAPGSGDGKRISIDQSWTPDCFFHVYDAGDGILRTYVITASGATSKSTSYNLSDFYPSTYSLGSLIVLRLTSNTNGIHYQVYDTNGIKINSATLDLPSSDPQHNNLNYDYTTMLVRQSNEDLTWHYNTLTNQWDETPEGYYNDLWTPINYHTGNEWDTILRPGVIVESKPADRIYWFNDRTQEESSPIVPHLIIDGGGDLFDSGNIITTDRTEVSPGTALVVGETYTVRIAGGVGNIKNPWQGGTGYSATLNVSPTGGHGSGYNIDIYGVDGDGAINGFATNSPGDGYCIGDVLTVPGGDGNAYFVITELDAGTVDDFTNVGYDASETTFVGALPFVATDTTPTTWTHGSIVNRVVKYTHTQMPGDTATSEAALADFQMDGAIVAGTSLNFGSSSQYFTNLYPGLFVMCVDSPDITNFTTSGNLGSDEDTQSSNDSVSVTNNGGDGNVYQYYQFQSRDIGKGDPSLNVVVIVENGAVTSATRSSTEDYFYSVKNAGGIATTRLHYLMWSKAHGVLSSDEDVDNIVKTYLSFVAPAAMTLTLGAVLATLNTNYSKITSLIGSHDFLNTLRVWTQTHEYLFNVPQFDALIVGKDKLLIEYNDPLRDYQVTAILYSLDGTQSSKVESGYSYNTTPRLIGDRALLRTESKVMIGGYFYILQKIHLISLNGNREKTIKQLTGDNYMSTGRANDFTNYYNF